MNNPRTLSGVNGNTIEQINLPSTIDAILINGNPGERGQVLAKNETTNKLEWDYVDDITIPDNSISGDKLKTDITFSTTGLIRAHEFFSNYFIVPQNGTQQVILDSDGITMVGNLEIDAPSSYLKINNILCKGSGGVSPVVDIETGNLRLQNGIIQTYGNIELYDSNEVKNIELDGSNGVIDCIDINISSHSGLITFDSVRCDTFNANTISIPEDPVNSGGVDFLLTDSVMTFSNAYTISGVSSNATFKTLTLNGGVSPSLICLGGLTTGSDTNGNEGNIIMNTGDISLTNGNFLQSSLTSTFITSAETTFKNDVEFQGDNHIDFVNKLNNLTLRINNLNGDISSASGDITLGKSGSTPPPTDGTYTDWALNISNNNGHGYIGGNLIVNGTIYGSVEGSITEEVVDCQRLNIRNGGVSGNTEINMNNNNIIVGNGKIKTDNGSYSYLELDFSSTPKISFKNNNYITQNAINLEHDFIEIYSTGSVNQKRIILNNSNGIEMYSENSSSNTNQLNTQLTKDGDLEYLTDSGLISGYFDKSGSGTTYTSYSTPMKHMRLDNTNYKYHTYEIGVNIPLQTYYERTFSSTSTSWVDLNDQLTIKLISNGESLSYFVVDFSFYAVITSGSRLWFKLFSSALSPQNSSQPSYLNNTMCQCYLDTNGASDFAGVHNVRFFVRGLPANITVNTRVAVWVIANSGHKVIFKNGPLTLGSNSLNPSTTYNKFPPMILQAHKLLDSTNLSINTPTGWTNPSAGDDY